MTAMTKPVDLEIYVERLRSSGWPALANELAEKGAAIAELIGRHAELEVAAARLAVERAEYRRDREALTEALLVALPYVTDAEGFPEQFKPGVVKKHVNQIRTALARIQGENAGGEG